MRVESSSASTSPRRYGDLRDCPNPCAIDARAGRYTLARMRDGLHAVADRETKFLNSRGVYRRERRGSYGFHATLMAENGRRVASSDRADPFSPFASLFRAANVERLITETERWNAGPSREKSSAT